MITTLLRGELDVLRSRIDASRAALDPPEPPTGGLYRPFQVGEVGWAPPERTDHDRLRFV